MQENHTLRNPALLIIDMQNDFVRPDGPMPVRGAEKIIGPIQSVLDAFREKWLPVIHVLRIHRKNGCDVEIMRQDIFSRTPFAVEETPGAAVISELEPEEGEILLHKTRMSAFMNTELDLILRTLGCDSVVIAGIQTPNCIRTTAFDAMAYNYPTWLVEDAIAAQSEEIHQANLNDMKNIGIRCIRTDELVTLLG